jgi:hypothetical protein
MAQQEKPPQLRFIGDDLEDLIQRIRGTERDYPHEEDVKQALSEAIEVLKAAENSIKAFCGPGWFFIR